MCSLPLPFLTSRLALRPLPDPQTRITSRLPESASQHRGVVSFTDVRHALPKFLGAVSWPLKHPFLSRLHPPPVPFAGPCDQPAPRQLRPPP
jgi:hypothetical protein